MMRNMTNIRKEPLRHPCTVVVAIVRTDTADGTGRNKQQGIFDAAYGNTMDKKAAVDTRNRGRTDRKE